MTAPFGAALETALKEDVQGGKLSLRKDITVNPRFFCCLSGLNINKEPVAQNFVDVHQVCINTPVNVDYSHSWSPSSTIASWEVDWGDGNVSSGAWPGAGTVTHPDGGYSFPGDYSICLTVTDLLGVQGFDEQQVAVYDCDALGVEVYCTTDAAGVAGIWYTSDAGGNWADRAGEVLANTPVYDLKINPFTIPFPEDFIGYDNTEFLELWAATEKGLYKCTDGARTGQSWKRITLPSQPGYGEPHAHSIAISKVNPLEVFVLAHGGGLYRNPVWVYRTQDGGETWNNGIEVGTEWPIGAPLNCNGLSEYGRTYAIDTIATDGMVIIMLPYYTWNPAIPPVGHVRNVDIVFYFPDEGDDWWYADGLGDDDDPTQETWFGVYCDPIDPSLFWTFGNENYNWKPDSVMNYWVSYIPSNVYDPIGLYFYYINYNWEYIGDESWNVNARVCPFLPSFYYPFEYIEIVNIDAQVWEGRVGWEPSRYLWPSIYLDSQAAISTTVPFYAQCGARSTWDENIIFIGRYDVGVGPDTDHLAISIDGGVNWTERSSSGLPAYCPITSIAIVGGMFE